LPPKNLDLDWKPRLPEDLNAGIGIVGAGAIVAGAHLPAYRMAGFNVVGITNRTRSRAEDLARKFDIPKVYDDLEDMLADERISIIDIAASPWAQFDLAVMAADAGRHILCQKPLHEELADAHRLVAAIDSSGVKVAVNQQLRWDARMRASRQIIDEGWLGTPTITTVYVSILNPWDLEFLAESRYQEIMYHSIHYFDTMRFLFGEPDRVYCSTGAPPGSDSTKETRSTTALEYDAGHTVLVHSSTDNPSGKNFARFRFEGTDGVISGDYDLFTGDVEGNPETLSLWSSHLPTKEWTEVFIPERRVPDAFIGPMASLMCAVEDDGTPDPSAEDNLNTIRLLHAIYESAREHQVVEMATFGV